MIKSVLIYEYQHQSTRANTNQRESHTNQHDPTRVNANQHESETNQHKSKTSLYHKKYNKYG